MNGLVDAIKTNMSELVEFTIHGERDIKITWRIKKKDFMFGRIYYKNEINIGTRGERHGVVAIIDATEINRER